MTLMVGHAHHWLIEPTHGEPTNHAVCSKCSAERDYPAVIEDGHLGTNTRLFLYTVDKGYVFPLLSGNRRRRRPRT